MSNKQIVITLFTTVGLLLIFASTGFAADLDALKFDQFADESNRARVVAAAFEAHSWKAIAAALAISIAAFGGALGQGRAAAAALEGIARNPSASGRIFTPMLLGLALIESLVIYALLIAFQVAP